MLGSLLCVATSALVTVGLVECDLSRSNGVGTVSSYQSTNVTTAPPPPRISYSQRLHCWTVGLETRDQATWLSTGLLATAAALCISSLAELRLYDRLPRSRVG
ncbi:MAG: hypothetical protein QF805_10190 [Pirellulaceae bacterium]|jgi:hypothetical protein|nr:hypothetical protein [Pirellulaceae bacterium]